MRTQPIVLLVAVLCATGCSQCKQILQPDHVDAGDGDARPACTTNAMCTAETVCVNGGCQPPGSVGTGGTCSASRDCGMDLNCAEIGVCVPAGMGATGATCASGADCVAGLACVHYGFSGQCEMPGTVDLGGSCNATSNCIAGLVCGSANTCEPVVSAYPPYAGVTCADDLATFGGYFEIPRGASPLADFYRLPFPNDVRVGSDGTLRLTSFPRPGKTLLGVDLVDLYASALQSDFTGFSTVAPVTFRFTRELDFNSLGGGANIRYVDITDPLAPSYGLDVPRSWNYDSGKHKLICQQALVVGNSLSSPLIAGHTYAAYLTTAIRSKTGQVPIVGADLTAVLGATQPTDVDLAAAWTKHAAFRDYLTRKAIDPATIANVAVFTVGDPTKHARAIGTAVTATALPTLTDLTVCDGTNVSPCAGAGGRACGNSAGSFWEIHGRFTEPNFQAGTAPFATPDQGGAIAYSGGAPVAVGTQAVCFALTIPKTKLTNVPLVVHAHGTGGSFEAAISDGIADKLATASTPMATLTFDGILHGARNSGSPRSVESLVFNVLNPRAARDNHLQGAVDVIQALRIAQIAPTAVAGVGTISFDPTRTYFFGHSQGSNMGILGVAESPDAKAAVFSGAGSDLTIGILTKTSPLNAKAGIELVLGEPVGGGHPMMVLWQTFFDSIDPINHARLLVFTPPSGIPSKHVMQTWSATDTYAPKATLTATAQAAGLAQAGPVIEAIGALDARPILTDVTGGDGKQRLAAVFQYATDGSYDGHFVAQRNPQAIADWLAFFTSLAGTGSPDVP